MRPVFPVSIRAAPYTVQPPQPPPREVLAALDTCVPPIEEALVKQDLDAAWRFAQVAQAELGKLAQQGIAGLRPEHLDLRALLRGRLGPTLRDRMMSIFDSRLRQVSDDFLPPASASASLLQRVAVNDAPGARIEVRAKALGDWAVKQIAAMMDTGAADAAWQTAHSAQGGLDAMKWDAHQLGVEARHLELTTYLPASTIAWMLLNEPLQPAHLPFTVSFDCRLEAVQWIRREWVRLTADLARNGSTDPEAAYPLMWTAASQISHMCRTLPKSPGMDLSPFTLLHGTTAELREWCRSLARAASTKVEAERTPQGTYEYATFVTPVTPLPDPEHDRRWFEYLAKQSHTYGQPDGRYTHPASESGFAAWEILTYGGPTGNGL